jgi:hypothetical protein
MKKVDIFKLLVKLKQNFIASLTPNTMKDYNGKSFTRVRSLTFARLFSLIIRCSPYSLQIRLDDYFKEIDQKGAVVSKQAFSKARTNLEPDILKSSFQLTAQTMSGAEDLSLYRNKYRLCAIDGSEVILDNAKELLSYFGGSGANKDCATALASVCYDPLNDIVLDGGLYPYGTSERTAAREHFKAVSMLPLPSGTKNLYIFDRGYPSRELFADMIDGGMCFLMRVRKKFNTEFDLSSKNEKVTFEHSGKQYQVRVFKVTLESNEQEILVTNIREKHLSRNEVGDLYFKRWRIEVKFDSLKNKLELENMSGRRVVTTFQDFWAKLDMANMTAALEYSTNEVINEETANSSRKYKQITNENRLITKFSESYIDLLTRENPEERLELFNELVEDIARRPSEIKPDRHFERVTPRKKNFCDRRKRVLR